MVLPLPASAVYGREVGHVGIYVEISTGYCDFSIPKPGSTTSGFGAPSDHDALIAVY